MARILIVDDSPTETFRFKEILGKHGFEVIEASNGADGVTMAQAELPDLVLMDVVMPGVNSRIQGRGLPLEHRIQRTRRQQAPAFAAPVQQVELP